MIKRTLGRLLLAVPLLAFASACGDTPMLHAPDAGLAAHLTPPQNVTATVLSDGYVRIDWTYTAPAANGVDRWRLFRRPQGTLAWTQLKTSPRASERTALDRNYDPTIDAWEYMVRGCAGGDDCVDSATPAQISGLRLGGPTGIFAKLNSPTKIVLK